MLHTVISSKLRLLLKTRFVMALRLYTDISPESIVQTLAYQRVWLKMRSWLTHGYWFLPVLVGSGSTQLLVSQQQKPGVLTAMSKTIRDHKKELLSDEAPVVYRAMKLTVYDVKSIGEILKLFDSGSYL